MGRQALVLTYAIRPRVVCKHFGELCVALAILTVVPGVVALFCHEIQSALAYGIVAGCLLFAGVGLARLRAKADLQSNETLVLAALTFLTASLLMTIPFMSIGLGFSDALFESVSGCTTTGLSTLETVQDRPTSFLFARAWMQWYGGLGFAVFSVALIIRAGETSRALVAVQSDQDGEVSGAKVHARHVLSVYSILTAIGVVVLLASGLQLMPAIEFTCAAVSTGGFSPLDQSLADMSGLTQAATTGICVAGAVSFSLYSRAARFGWGREFPRNLQLRGLLLLGLLTTLALGSSLFAAGMPWSDVSRHAPLIGLSAQTTTGFSSLSIAGLDSVSKLILMASMFVGGSVGSSAGGIKILRFLVVLQVLHHLIVRACLPRHAVLEPELGGRRLSPVEIQEAFSIFVLFALVIGMSWLPFVAMGYDPLDSLFEVVSATGTVGLSTGISDASLPTFLKGVLCVDMLLGRLEILAWLVLCYPRTWFGQRGEAA